MYSTLLLPLCLIPAVFAIADPIHIPIRKRVVTPRGIEHYAAAAERLREKYGFSHSHTKFKRQKSASVPIIDQNSDSSYFGTISVGTPGQNLNVILDTGSADLWVATTECTTCSSQTPTFDISKSSTFKVASGQSDVAIHYGSGEVQGNVVEDSVSMGGFTVNPQILAAVDQTSRKLLQGSASGIMGLGFQAIASTQALPFWQGLLNGNQLSSPEMSFALARLVNVNNVPTEAPGGTFTLGGTNTSLYTGDIEFLDLAGSPSFWLLSLKSLTLGGNALPIATGNSALSAIDTGTTLIGGPTADVAAFWKAVPNSAPVQGMDGLFSFPCSTQLDVAMSFGGKTWPISSLDMNLGAIPEASDQCLGGIFDLSQGSNAGSGNGPSWVVGDTFLKNVYSVFRASPPSVGFAQLSNGSGSPGSPGSTPAPGGGSVSGGTQTIVPLSLLTISLSVLVATYLGL